MLGDESVCTKTIPTLTDWLDISERARGGIQGSGTAGVLWFMTRRRHDFFFYRAAFVKRLAERGMTVSLSLPCWFGDAKYSTQSSFSSVKVSGTCAKFEGEE